MNLSDLDRLRDSDRNTLQALCEKYGPRLAEQLDRLTLAELDTLGAITAKLEGIEWRVTWFDASGLDGN